MSWLTNKPPWYAGGLVFECRQCGRCCAGPEEGYVWVNSAQISSIAGFLGISRQQLADKYLRQVGNRYSLIEQSDSRDCVFLNRNELGQRRCAIYPQRPTQCRTWPFWACNLADPDAWLQAAVRCPGINYGRLFELDEIERRRNGKIV